ncbi:MAG: hypothetical protein KF729_20525 [Sandaracinaceae bacterium]|nr:hypothetical protein [Sandaracinaceae bacterium]
MAPRLAVPLVLLALLAPTRGAAQVPEQLGPYWFGDARARVRPALFVQLQLAGEGADLGALAWEPRLRRLRPVLQSSLFEGRVTTSLHLELRPDAPELVDLWADVRADDALHLRVGQLKTPFTRFYQQPFIELAVDWPLTSRWFGGEHQLGAMVHGEHAASGLGYAAGVFGGQARRNGLARELARAYGEQLGNPSRLDAPAPSEPAHPELVARLDHAGREGALRHAMSFSASWDLAPARGRDFALRLAPELDLELGALRWTLVGYAGWIEDARGGLALGALGALSVLAWRADRHLALVLRYARVHVTRALRDDARAHADAVHATMDDEAWQARYARAGREHAHHELGVAVEVLVIGRSLTWQTDLSWLHDEAPGEAREGWRVRSQLQLAF